MAEYTVGIDLGTTNTVCWTYENTLEPIKLDRDYLLPSVLLYKDGVVTIGNRAKARLLREPESIIGSSKSYMDDVSKVWEIHGRKFTPTDVAHEILKKVNQAAKQHFQTEEPISAVITVPAYFTASEYARTKKAAEQAGFQVKQIISEPMAAALAYGLGEGDGSILVIDIGGGTFDLCLLRKETTTNQEQVFKTLYTGGDKKLGGDNFDDIMVELCYSALRTQHMLDLSTQERSGLSEEEYNVVCQKIRQQSEKAKVLLSSLEETEIEITNLCQYNGRPINFRLPITRAEYEKACDTLLKRIRRIITRCDGEAAFDKDSIEKIIFVGGTSNMPCIRNFIKEYFGKEPYADKDLSSLVAMGAAIHARKDDDLVKISIQDTLSHSLGVRVKDGRFSIILERGATYPMEKQKTYYTVGEKQDHVIVAIYEGENLMDVEANKFYDDFRLDNIKTGKGVPIDVLFRIDADRTLHVTASDQATGATESIKITIPKSGEQL